MKTRWLLVASRPQKYLHLVAGAELLRKDGSKTSYRFVPSEGLFRSQSKEYQESIIPNRV